MGASIWEGSTTIVSTANADNTFKGQRFVVATAGQTVFTLTSFAYQVGTASLEVFINGVAQYIGVDFTETSNTVVTLTSGAEIGDIVVIRGFVGGTAAQAAEVSAAQAANSAALAYQYYQWTLALSPASLPLTIANGGTGQTTKAAAFLALAPTPVAGKVIGSTDGATFTMVDPAKTGAGSTSGNVTLTATSAQTQTVAPTTWGQYVTLPDATTLPTQGTAYVIENTSAYDLGIKDSAGNKLGWIRPRESGVVALKDNSTAAGGWFVVNGYKTAVTAGYSIATGSTYTGNIIPVVLDANRIMLLIGQTWSGGGSTGVAIVFDASSQTWGVPVTFCTALGSSGSAPRVITAAILAAANVVLVVYGDGANSNFITARTLSVSGTTITANAAVATSGTGATISTLVAVGTAFVLGYSTGTQANIMSLTVTGTVPAFSSVVTVAASSSFFSITLYPVTSSVVLAIACGGTTGTVVTPYTISGTSTPVAGTGLSNTSANVKSRSVAMSSGRFIVMMSESQSIRYWLVSVSGTTATQTAVVSGSINTGDVDIYSDIVAISATKALVTYYNSGIFNAIILTDTSGTLSAGSVFNMLGVTLSAATYSNNTLMINQISSNLAHITFNTYQTGSTRFWRGVLDVSGTTPTVSQAFKPTFDSVNYSGASGAFYMYATRYDGTRDARTLIASTAVNYPVPQLRSDVPYLFRLTADGMEKFTPPAPVSLPFDANTGYAKGLAANDVFVGSQMNQGSGSFPGFQLYRMEAVA